MQPTTHVKLTNAALDTFRGVDGKETLILRGVIDPDTLGAIQVAPYQREILSSSKIDALARALANSTVPDIELGMRGDKHRVSNADKTGEVWVLLDDTFVIDGLQRTTAARHLMQKMPDARPRLGAVVHFDTNYDWERERFRLLNQERTKISTNVLLRNLQTDSSGIDMLVKLCADESFVLKGRVQWNQKMLRNEVISALTLCKVVGILHSRFGPGRSNGSTELASMISTTMEVVGRTTMRDNIKTFFELLDQAFGVQRIVFVDGAAHIKTTFLVTLADVLTHHKDFWRGTRLFIDRPLRMKIEKFPINDPEVARLACSGGKAMEILYVLITDHINSGKRSKRLSVDMVGKDRVPTTSPSTEKPLAKAA